MGKNLVLKDKEITVKFKPRARLLLQLGDQLIRNESIALIELVKNSYDADASHVTVIMENVDDPDNGIIVIEDDGFGMNSQIVEDVWMEPGSDFKTEKFINLEVTPKFKRLPIGEKGIGRFGAHKLGNQIELITKKEGENEVYVKIDWSVFLQFRYLDQVPISIIERRTPLYFKDGQTGTKIIISDLRKEWTRGVARNVKRTINSLISPFKSNDSFVAEFNVLDKPSWFEGLLEWGDIKDYALYHFKVNISGNKLVSFDYSFTPWMSMSALSGRKINKSDDLVKQFSDLEDDNGEGFSLDDFNIGDVIFEGYIFDRDTFVLRLGVADIKGFKSYLDSNCGIRVFRDGLRVYDYGEPENDWLGLDLRRVNQPTKRLSNNIILGAIYLKRKDSYDLVEKTNREGFVENTAYNSFKKAVLHTLNIIEVLRFGDKQKLRIVYGPTPKSEPILQVLGDLKEYVEEKVEKEDIREEIIRYLVKIEDDYKRINDNLLKAAGAGLSMSVVIHEIEKIILEISKVLKAENASKRALNLIKHLDKLVDGYSSIIRKSDQSNEDLKEIIDQALTNIEYRLSAHKVKIIREYKKYQGKYRTKVARNLLIGCLMNIFDNSIYWLEKADRPSKKIFINLTDEEEGFLNIIISDNGTGFLLPTEEIIEPFVSAKPNGMGLGLHIASEVMLALRGKLSFPDWGDFEIPLEYKNGAIISLSFKK